VTRVPETLRAEVRERAASRCEYCRLPQHQLRISFHAEHIIAEQHDGPTILDNLAWACLQYNLAKGPNIASYDRETGELTPLYHPRQHNWDEHFEMIDGEILGKTSVGRVTARILKFNATQRVDLRQELIESGEWE
jgi:hypothetical protein